MATLISGSTGVDKIQDGTIVNADIASGAAIAGSKLVMPTGSVLQVVSSVFNSDVSTTSTSFTDTGHSVNITPISTSNKVLIQVSGGGMGISLNGGVVMVDIYRGSTSLSTTAVGLGVLYGASGGSIFGNHAMSFLDSPSSTSQVTYKIYYRSNHSSNTAYYHWSDKGKVVMTVTEIAG